MDKKSSEYARARAEYKDILAQGDKRACGACTACCVVLGVDDLPSGPKPRQEPCRHLESSGCGIYTQRPFSCRDFFCAWKSGFTPASARPDRVGIVVWMGLTSNGLYWFADELVPGAFQTAKGRSLVRELSGRKPMVVYQPDGSAKVVIRGSVRGNVEVADNEEVREMARMSIEERLERTRKT